MKRIYYIMHNFNQIGKDTFMKKNQVEDYLNNSMYGTKSFLTEEDVNFLGTFKERTYMALTKEQVLLGNHIDKISQLIHRKSDITLYLNGKIPLKYFIPYIKCAQKYKKTYTIVQTNLNEKSYGLILSSSKAIDEPLQIFL